MASRAFTSVGAKDGPQMPRINSHGINSHAQQAANSEDTHELVEIFDAAWVVVGRRAYALHPDEEIQLKLDLAVCLGRLIAKGVTELRDLVRRSIMKFVY